MEEETDGKLPVLDVLVVDTNKNRCKTTSYHKHTLCGQYTFEVIKYVYLS